MEGTDSSQPPVAKKTSCGTRKIARLHERIPEITPNKEKMQALVDKYPDVIDRSSRLTTIAKHVLGIRQASRYFSSVDEQAVKYDACHVFKCEYVYLCVHICVYSV
jgi:hypothetical protein